MPDLTRRAAITGALAAVALPLLPASAFPPPPGAARDPLWFVDPELRPAARQLQQIMQSLPAMTEANLPAIRAATTPPPAPFSPAVPVREERVPGLPGQPPVKIYVINARAGARRGGILHMHGGGFIFGSAANDARGLQDLAATLDCAIVTVEYRLAPESRYAGSIADNYAALRWLHAHARELGVDPARVAAMGGSAGGGHAALLALEARRRGEVPLCFQMLIYPMLDDRTGSSRPAPPTIGTLAWTADANRLGWRSFLGQAPGTASVPERAVPARVRDLSGLPPTFIGVGSIDLFVGEDIDYAHRLIEAGVPTELVVVPGAYHGFDLFAGDTGVARRFNAAVQGALRRAFAAA